MRLLLISFWFPPTNSIGAVRVGKLAKYLLRAGHEVRVLAGPEIGNLTLPLEVPVQLVTRPPRHAASFGEAPAQPSRAGRLLRRLIPAGASGLEAMLKRHYYALRQIPDKRIGWLRPALAGGRSLLGTWRPDLIIASGPPYTGLIVAARLSRESGVPWIAELRDPWANNPYSIDPGWRRRLDGVLERLTLGSAAALVTVSPPVTEELRHRYAKPIATILNGYSEEDMVTAPPRPSGDVLSIVYTGTIYAGFRDPSALFAAIARLDERRRHVRVTFYGPSEDEIRPLAERHGVWKQVSVQPGVPYRQSLAHQAAADVLLLLQRNHVTDEGNIPAKFFEYLAARRPILLLGCESGIVANMIRERRAGFVANDPAAIAAQLGRWLDDRPQEIAALSPAVLQGLSRNEQFAAYEAFLQARLGAVGT
jgi:glycosyltransferase involved in cell wall biosynthesis